MGNMERKKKETTKMKTAMSEYTKHKLTSL